MSHNATIVPDPCGVRASGVSIPQPLSPNRAQISAHLYALFPPSFVQPYPEAWIEIAYGHAAVNAAEIFSVFDLQKAADFAAAKNRAGFNIYIGPALRLGERPPDGRAKDSHVVTSSHAWAEFDAAGDDKRIKDILNAHNLKPALIVITGTRPHLRAHLYFRLDGTVTAEQLRAVNTALMKLLGTDSVHNNGRIMRLAGTVSYPSPKKQARGYVTELVALHTMPKARAYQAGKLIKLNTVDGETRCRDDRELLVLCETSRQTSQWHTSMRDAIATMIGRGWPDTAIKMACAPYCERGADDPDLLPLIEGARTKWNKPNEPDQQTIDVATTFTFLGDAPATPPRELIKKSLPAYGVAVTGGQSSGGKTFVEIYKAICLARSLPFFGRKIVEQVGTAFVAAEGRALIPNRFAAALAKHSITEKLPIAWINQLPDFASAEGIKLFIQQLKKLNERFQGDFGVRLGQIPIDTVAASFAMKDETDNSEATRVCNIMRTIGEETGALMVAVHHYGKNPESGLRGASAWKGSADVVNGVLADINPLSGRVSNRELVCTKARDGEEGSLSPFELEFVDLGLNEDHEVYGSCCVIPTLGASRFEKTATLSKSQRAIHDALAEALDGRGKLITPRPDMAPIKAARVADVREEFDRRYVVDEADPAKAANAKRMAFKRALDHLSPSKFGAGAAEGTDWLWIIK